MSPSTNASRWSPTPEQLMILEEMYRSGIRTPNAFQIQQITTHLSFYGRIEGKNVFYWFQNHKARDRQKLRIKLCSQLPPPQLHQHLHLDQHNRGFLHHLGARSSIGTHPFFYNSSGSFLQGVKKMEISSGRVEMEDVTRMHGYDWMIKKVNVDPHSHGPTKSPKTLQLFPTTSSNLKDECATSTQNPTPSH